MKAAQVLCRVTPEERERWKEAAARLGLSLNEFQRQVVNERVSDLLDCQHPWEYRKRYPWSETCLKCGARIKG